MTSTYEPTIYDVATRLEPMNLVGFAGGGGSTRGYHLAGQRVQIALNHNRTAMAMHRINHDDCEHFIEDIRTVDPRVVCAGRLLLSAWFSPDCRDFSKAKQGKPKSKRIRGLAWVIIDWINKLGPMAPLVVFLENVEEFAGWCPLLPNGKRNPKLLGWFFKCFVGALRRRGYGVEWREQRANIKGGHFALVSAVLVPRYGERHGQEPRSRSVSDPYPTVVNTGNGGSLAAIFLAQNNGGKEGHQTYGHSAAVPVSTISGKGCQQSLIAASLVKYYGADQDPQLQDPLHSITTLDRFGLLHSQLAIPPLTPELEKKARRVARFLRSFGVKFEGEFATVCGFVIVDIGMRMLAPRELYRAQGFPDDYVIDRGIIEHDDGSIEEVPLSGKDQVKMCGNSVSPVHAAAIIAANVPHPDLRASTSVLHDHEASPDKPSF